MNQKLHKRFLIAYFVTLVIAAIPALFLVIIRLYVIATGNIDFTLNLIYSSDSVRRLLVDGFIILAILMPFIGFFHIVLGFVGLNRKRAVSILGKAHFVTFVTGALFLSVLPFLIASRY